MDNFDRYIRDLAKKCQKKERLDESDQEKILAKIPQLINELSTQPAMILDLIDSTQKLQSIGFSIREKQERKKEELKLINAFRTDVVLRCRLMEIANSPFYYIDNSEKIKVERLVRMFGPIELRKILLNVFYVSSKLKPHDNTYGINSKSFWLHSTSVGLCLETFYDYLDEPEMTEIQEVFSTQNVEQIYSYLFLIGLFHDIGKIVLSQKLYPLYRIVVERQQEIDKAAHKVSTIEIEEKFFNFTHVRIGEDLLSHKTFDSKLLKIVVEVMKCHHDLDYDAKEYKILGKLLYLANSFLQTDQTVAEYGLALANRVEIEDIKTKIGKPFLFGNNIERICNSIENKLFDILRQQGFVSKRASVIIDTEIRQQERIPEHVVFISSTFEDLKVERKVAIKAIKDLNISYWAMEMLGARPDPPIEICLDAVLKSEIYIVIIGQKYGSCPKDRELSCTELEYIRARQYNLKRFVYFRSNDALVMAKFMEKDPVNLGKLNNFIEELKNDPQITYSRFKSIKELEQTIKKDVKHYLDNSC